MVERAHFNAFDEALADAAHEITEQLIEAGFPDSAIATIGFTLIQWSAVVAIRAGVDVAPVLKRMANGLLLLASSKPDEIDGLIQALIKSENPTDGDESETPGP